MAYILTSSVGWHTASYPTRTLPSRKNVPRKKSVSSLSMCLAVEAEKQIIKQWDTVKNEEQFFAILKEDASRGKIPEQLIPLWADFYNNYKKAVLGSGVPGADEELVAKIQASIADRVINQFVDPYTFPSFHQRLLTPYDYYQFGQNYVGTLIDFQNSVLGNRQQWDQIQQQIDQGHNVVLFTNHQTEADPAVFAHMLASSHPQLATDVCYVAGDRVVEDPLCKPFSMGRNLYCVHSKRHMDDVPELKDYKQKVNRKTLKLLSENLQKGGNLLWIAPAGGRDRPNAEGHYEPAPFDASAIELMRRLSEAAQPQQHLYSMAMWCYPVMPPPSKVEGAQLGERRLTNFTGVGISVGSELDVDAITQGIEDKAVRIETLSNAIYENVKQLYVSLEEGIHNPSRRHELGFQQPWLSS